MLILGKHLVFTLLCCLILVVDFKVANSTTVSVPSGGDVQGAIDSAQCGDSVVLQAGATFDGAFILPNKNCTSASQITIRSSALSLPASRVGPADAPNMPRLRAPNGQAIFTMGANSGWWVLDGLELTDNAGHGLISNLIDAQDNTGTHDLTLQRCYIHQKEDPTEYHRSILRAIHFEGSGLLMKWNYIFLIGYYYQEVSGTPFQQMDTTSMLSIGGSRITMEDNYISTWWNQFFLGGADTAPQNTAALSNATKNIATFSNTTGLTPGVVVRFELHGTGTVNRTGIRNTCANTNGTWPGQDGTPSSATITQTSGAALSQSDWRRVGRLTNSTDGSSGLFGLCEVSGNTFTFADVVTNHANSGAVDWVLYETAIVTSVVGSTVTYQPYGNGALNSSGATSASWNYGDQGLVTDVNIRKNTFYVDPSFAHDVYVKHGYSPKGITELKVANRFTFEGNRVLGYPAVFAIYPANQYGTAPWVTVRDVNFRNNLFSPDTGYPESTREALAVFSANDYSTISPLKNISISNNLFKGGISSFAATKQVDNIQIFHNTVLNVAPTTFSYSDVLHGSEQMTNFSFRDNIVAYRSYGMNCFLGGPIDRCWSGSFLNNVVVDNDLSAAPLNTWGVGGILGPILPTLFSGVGFTNLAEGNYRLLSTSSFHNRATDGTDPGINQDVLEAALDGAVTPAPTPTPTPTPIPTPTPRPTPTPPPTIGPFTIVTTDSGSAAVFNSMSMMASPFDIVTEQNFGIDNRTRLTIFAIGITSVAQNSDPSNDLVIGGISVPNFAESVGVEARRSDGIVFMLPVEFAGARGTASPLEQVNLRLLPELHGAGAVQLTLIINGQRSNSGAIFIR